MKRIAIALVIALSVISLSRVGAQDDAVMRAMRDELARSMERLQLEKLDRPYFIAYRISDYSQTSASASMGSLIGSGQSRGRMLNVELRVGNYDMDNTNFVSMSFGMSGVSRMFGGSMTLPLEDNYQEIRRQIWLATDGVYKKALEDIAKKRAALANKTRTEEQPDFSRAESVTSSEMLPAAEVAQADAEKTVRELSALFRDSTHVFSSGVDLQVTNAYTRYVNSEGSMYTRSRPAVTLTARAETQAENGMSLADVAAFYGRSLSDLSNKEISVAIRGLEQRIARLRAAPVAEHYTGPVLIEDQAAAELFGQVFASKLVAARQPVSDNPQFDMAMGMMRGSQSPFQDKLGSRVLPVFLSVTDNPTVEEFSGTPLLAGYKVDDEAVPARATVLVEKGILRTLLNTRVPVRGIPKSSGSRRGGGPAPSNVIVSAEGGLGDAELREELLKLVKQRNAPYGMVLRRVVNPSQLAMSARDPMAIAAAMLGRPGANDFKGVVLAYKVFPDGREELVRNVEIADFTVALFKEIVAVSRRATVLTTPVASRSAASIMAFDFSPSDIGGVPVSLVVPALLFEEMTLKPPSGEIPKPPILKHPLMAN